MRYYFLLCLLFFGSFLAEAQTSTMVTVRAKARDAKFIGSSIGGAQIIIRDATTGIILAEGVTEGGTGNTTRIMSQSTHRYDQLSDVNTAAFRAEIMLEEPVFVTIEARAPVDHRQAEVVASTQMWLIPGKDILQDGVVLEIPGFIIDTLEPRTHQSLVLDSLQNRLLSIRANMVMMCGCTISDGGLWNAREIEVRAIIKRNGVTWRTLPMAITEPNLFEVQTVLDGPGQYQVTVYAFDHRTANSGVDIVHFRVE